ncbi:MAG TPA: 2-dehydropantoate 2-reductase [Patescibacteria group bacterium]|nr:2-dehydropantoate 2-reductase [Patescibacteria group bacterium]
MRVGIFGAGSIGAYLGAMLARSGADVVLLGRPALADAAALHGLRVSDNDGCDVCQRDVVVGVSHEVLRDRQLIFVTTKSADTDEAGATLARLFGNGEGRSIVSFQNGVGNADVLRRHLPCARVFAGMVPYNVVWHAPAHFHRGTSGALMIEAKPGADAIVALLRVAGLVAETRPDLVAVLWGKLLLNLNNPVNALTGMPLKQQLLDRGCRRIVSALMREGLRVLDAAGIVPAKAGKVGPRLVPLILDLPTVLFARVAASMLKLDDDARSSMWDDLNKRRRTEIDWINGEIVRLAERHHSAAPLNAAVIALIREAEAAGQGSPRWSAAQIVQRLGLR